MPNRKGKYRHLQIFLFFPAHDVGSQGQGINISFDKQMPMEGWQLQFVSD